MVNRPKPPNTVRKQARKLMIQRLRDGVVYGGKPRESQVMRTVDIAGVPTTVPATFYHISKFHLEELNQPSRYKEER